MFRVKESTTLSMRVCRITLFETEGPILRIGEPASLAFFTAVSIHSRNASYSLSRAALVNKALLGVDIRINFSNRDSSGFFASISPCFSREANVSPSLGRIYSFKSTPDRWHSEHVEGEADLKIGRIRRSKTVGELIRFDPTGDSALNIPPVRADVTPKMPVKNSKFSVRFIFIPLSILPFGTTQLTDEVIVCSVYGESKPLPPISFNLSP